MNILLKSTHLDTISRNKIQSDLPMQMIAGNATPFQTLNSYGTGKECMKILQIITLGDSIGGAQVHVLDLSKGLNERGHDVFVLSGSEGELNRRLSEAGVSNISIPLLQRSIHPWEDIKCFIALRKFIKKYQPDIVASHSSKAGLLVRLVCFSLRQANVFTVHGWSFGETMPLLKRAFFIGIELLLRPFTHRIVNVSNENQLKGKKYHLLPSHRSSVIYNGVVDFAKKNGYNKGIINGQQAILTENTHFTEGGQKPFVMLMSARFQEPKNHVMLLHALRSLKNENWVLYCLGDGKDTLVEVKNLTEMYGFRDKIKFVGYVPDILPYLKMADVSLLISNWEGLPLSILEAMSLSLPTIATRVGGIPEQIEDGVNGFLVERTDTEGLTQAIEKLQNDTFLRKRMGQAARHTYEKKFQLQKMIEKTESLYYSAIKKTI